MSTVRILGEENNFVQVSMATVSVHNNEPDRRMQIDVIRTASLGRYLSAGRRPAQSLTCTLLCLPHLGQDSESQCSLLTINTFDLCNGAREERRVAVDADPRSNCGTM